LTPQTCERFRSRFEKVAVLHSHLRDAQRHWHWERIARGEVQVVVGARSAVFAPVPNLGLIILDEEHESSFKQDVAPRYHARDVALWRAREERVPLVLASATPSLESWYRASQGDSRLVEMPRRVFNRPLPAVGTIDLRTEFHSRKSRGAVSRQMHQAIDAALKDGGQVMLLLNRRGYSTHIQCPACGTAVRCPNCDLPLTHHRTGDLAICHYCDFQQPSPTECPECHASSIHYSGLGTQRLEAEVRARFRDATVLRMDTDTMKTTGSHERALTAFREGKVQILLGTQMIAKGLDFPNVTLVGVINADIALHLPDFRAAERTFQLVTQVAGRTGRGDKGGRVLVQTFSPDHPAIQAAVRHDFGEFARYELPLRHAHQYPPTASMVRIIVRGETQEPTRVFAQHLGDRLREAVATSPVPTRVAGPAAAPIARLRGMHRFHLQLQSADSETLRTAIRLASDGLEPPAGILWTADVDPLDML
jgi:primosomal protein N' (replication factor Y)